MIQWIFISWSPGVQSSSFNIGEIPYLRQLDVLHSLSS